MSTHGAASDLALPGLDFNLHLARVDVEEPSPAYLEAIGCPRGTLGILHCF